MNIWAKKDRLLLLSTIARTRKQDGLAPEPALLDRLIQLHDQTDFRKVQPDKTIEIAKRARTYTIFISHKISDRPAVEILP